MIKNKRSSSNKNSGIFRTNKKGKSTKKGSLRRTLTIIIGSAVLFALSVYIIPRIVNHYSKKQPRNFSFLDLFSFTEKATYGIDVSVHQGKIEWGEISTFRGHPITFVYIKATEGATRKDRTYERNIEEARKTDLLIGSYHFFKANRDPKTQFDNFQSIVDRSKQDLVPMIDVEEIVGVGEELFKERLHTFVQLIEEYYGKKPLIYSQNSFFNRHLADRYSSYPLMIARYHTQQPRLDNDIKWTIWQFTEEGKLDGIRGYVDLNILNNEVASIDDIRL